MTNETYSSRFRSGPMSAGLSAALDHTARDTRPWYERQASTQDADLLLKRLRQWKANRDRHDGLGSSLLADTIDWIEAHRD